MDAQLRPSGLRGLCAKRQQARRNLLGAEEALLVLDGAPQMAIRYGSSDVVGEESTS